MQYRYLEFINALILMNITCASILSTILKEVKKHGIDVVSNDSLKACFDYLSDKLNVSPIQGILIACILESSFSRAGTTVKQICTLLKCTNIDFLQYSSEIDALIDRQMVEKSITLSSFSDSVGYELTSKLIKAIKNDETFVDEPMTNLSPESFFDVMCRLFVSRLYERDQIDALKESLDKLLYDNSHLAFSKAIFEYDINHCETLEFLMFMNLCSNYVNQGTDHLTKDSILGFSGAISNVRSTFNALKNERWKIQQKGLIEFGNDGGMSDTDIIALSDLAKEQFFTDLSVDPEPRKNCPDLISHETIAFRNLFYNEADAEQIRRLGDILKEDYFREIQSRLEASSMRKGFNCLFWGAPGTGKTETVYQLARESGRDVLQIDISKLRSKWVGESEKTVRSIFKHYQWLVRHSKIAPILLFNEADGIFGIRTKMAEGSIDKMNNTIQNILLQEMEKLDGILIATTNMTENLDNAFERRFLYKVEFTVPEPKIRASIWQSMLPFLPVESAEHLASQFCLSGGQIENVSRKCAVEFILGGSNPSLEAIEDMCRQENSYRKKGRIGF